MIDSNPKARTPKNMTKNSNIIDRLKIKKNTRHNNT